MYHFFWCTLYMWVGGVGWSQTFINHCFYGIFDQIYESAWGGWVQKFGTFTQIKQFFFCFFLGGGLPNSNLTQIASFQIMPFENFHSGATCTSISEVLPRNSWNWCLMSTNGMHKTFGMNMPSVYTCYECYVINISTNISFMNMAMQQPIISK